MPSMRDVREERERRDMQGGRGPQGYLARPAILASFAFLAAVLAGCGISPTVHFYTLSAGASPGGDASPALAAATISVGPVTLPDVVDRPQLVLRTGANQVVIAEEHRWAEPLKGEIPRVLAENLAQMLGVKQVWSYPQSATDKADVRVLVDVQRFDSTPGESAVIDVYWTVRRGESEPTSGRSLVKGTANGSGYDALAAAHGRALVTVSRDIAVAIRATETAGAKTAPTPSPPPATPAPPASAPAH